MKRPFYSAPSTYIALFAWAILFASCEFSPPPEQTCADGIKNYTEEAIDCGGDCFTCGTCDDGILNGSETDIDCGGTCTPCSCKNNVQDVNETMIDCGGSCAPCDVPACTVAPEAFIFRRTGGWAETTCTIISSIGQMKPAVQSLTIYASKPDGYEYMLYMKYYGPTLTTTGTQSYRIPLRYSADGYFDLSLYEGSTTWPTILYQDSGYIQIDCNQGKITISSCNIAFDYDGFSQMYLRFKTVY